MEDLAELHHRLFEVQTSLQEDRGTLALGERTLTDLLQRDESETCLINWTDNTTTEHTVTQARVVVLAAIHKQVDEVRAGEATERNIKRNIEREKDLKRALEYEKAFRARPWC